jgi:hypothetical protein
MFLFFKEYFVYLSQPLVIKTVSSVIKKQYFRINSGVYFNIFKHCIV